MNIRSKWFVFALLAVAQFMVVLDVAIVNVSLPAIKQALGFDAASLQWVVTAYALAFGGFLLLGGRAADLFGRRRMLLIGMTGFTLSSLLIGATGSATLIVVLRALQGLSAAFMSPAALSIVLTTFRDGQDRNRALGLWTVVATGGAAVGILMGGILTEYLSWRWDFLINVPIGVIVGLLIWRSVPAHASESAHRDLDLPGAALVTAGLITLVYAFTQASTWGWTGGATWAAIGLALALLVGFVFNERASRHPLMPLSLFKVRNVTGANLMMALMYAGVMGMFFLMSIYFQAVLHFSPVQSGLAFLPFPIILGTMSTRVAGWVSQYGYKRFLVMGPLLAIGAMLWLSRLPVDGSYWPNVLPAILILPLGMSMTFMPLTAAATSGVPAHEAGLASGLISTSQQMGGALGLAVLTSVAASVTAGAGHGAAALIAGYDRAFLFAVVFMTVALVVALTVIRQRRGPGSNSGNRQLAGSTEH